MRLIPPQSSALAWNLWDVSDNGRNGPRWPEVSFNLSPGAHILLSVRHSGIPGRPRDVTNMATSRNSTAEGHLSARLIAGWTQTPTCLHTTSHTETIRWGYTSICSPTFFPFLVLGELGGGVGGGELNRKCQDIVWVWFIAPKSFRPSVSRM